MTPQVASTAVARHSRARLEPGDIAPGEPLPLDVFDRSGLKLLGRGQVVRTMDQLERLLEIGLWGDAEALQGLRAGQAAARGAAPAVAPTRFHALSAFDELRALRVDLHALLAAWSTDPAASVHDGGQAVRALAARLMHAVELDPDAAIATLTWLRDRPYASRQAVNVAVVTDLLLAHGGADAVLRGSAVCAALTMNLSIHSLQDDLYDVKTPTAAQQAEIRAHPHAAALRLEAAGIDDRDWLDAVRQHHESADGSGYPAGLRGTQATIAARAIGIADRFCAVVSERAYRPAVPMSAALSRMFNGSSPALDPGMSTTLNRVLGAWPPGTVVLLRSAELAVVTHRTADPRGPIARAVRTRDGVASAAFPKRLTHRDTFAIVEEAAHDRLPPGLDVASLWHVALEAMPS
jgi:hypothetical protein